MPLLNGRAGAALHSSVSSSRVVAHVADLHFGRRMARVTSGGDNLREMDIYAAGKALSEYLAELKPDLVVVAGDVWDTASPSPQALRHGYDFHRRLQEAEIETVVVGGNHDTLSTPGRPTPLQHLERYFGCQVVLEQQQLEVADLRLCAVPYRTLSMGEFEEPDYSSEVPNLLVVHAAVDGDDMPAFAQYDYTRLSRAHLFDDRACLRMLGHIHIHQSVGDRAYYCGAPERLTWGEITNTPAIYLHEVSDNGEVATRSVSLAEMGVEGVPRPVQLLEVDCSELTGQVALEKAVSLLDQSELDGTLTQVSFLEAPAEIYSLHYEELLGKRAAAGGAVAFRPRVLLREEDDISKPVSVEVEQVPGAALSEAYRSFAEANQDQDLAELGCELIAQQLGEVEA